MKNRIYTTQCVITIKLLLSKICVVVKYYMLVIRAKCYCLRKCTKRPPAVLFILCVRTTAVYCDNGLIFEIIRLSYSLYNERLCIIYYVVIKIKRKNNFENVFA